jgi:hypothetical protein
MSGIREWFRKLGIYGYLLIALLIIIAAYFIIVHQAHLAAYSTIIFIMIFIGLHLLMHAGGHGSHGGRGGGGCGGGSHEEHEGPEHGGTGKDGEDKTVSGGKEDEESTKRGRYH